MIKSKSGKKKFIVAFGAKGKSPSQWGDPAGSGWHDSGKGNLKDQSLNHKHETEQTGQTCGGASNSQTIINYSLP